MKKYLIVGLIFVLSLSLLSCSSPVVEEDNQEIVVEEDNQEIVVEEEPKEEVKTYAGKTTAITTGIPKNAIVGAWVNTEDFDSETTINLLPDKTGTFINDESTFKFDYELINNKLIRLKSTSGQTLIDPNIELFIGPGGGPVSKNYVYEYATLLIDDFSFTRNE